MKLIEYVCSANHGRSWPCEAIGRVHLYESGLLRRFNTSSSGSHLKEIISGEASGEQMEKIISLGLARDIFPLDSDSEIERAIRDNNSIAIADFYRQAQKHFHAEEHQWRIEALAEFGILPQTYLESMRENQVQTVVNPDAIAVLSMATSNNDKVKQIYRNYLRANPLFDGIDTITIDTLGHFVNPSAPVEIINPYGMSKDVYFKTIEQLIPLVRQSVNKAVQ
jgi:protein-tyrosine-phosphatase